MIKRNQIQKTQKEKERKNNIVFLYELSNIIFILKLIYKY